MRQIPLDLGLLPALSFDSFNPRGNEAAWHHLRALKAAAPPVYLWGPVASGKTHLLRAVAAAWVEAGGSPAWFDPSVTPPWELPAAAAVVLIDDCHALAPAAQHAAFALFIEALQRELPIIASGRLPPVDLAVRDDFRTRLGWGHVFALQPLPESEVRARLRREADLRGVPLSDEVMEFLLTRFDRDLKHLLELLARLDGYAMAERRALTVPTLKKMLSEEGATT